MTQHGDFFPSYLQWLARHDDEVLHHFFTDMLESTYPDGTRHLNSLAMHSPGSLDALLTQLDGVELAILHAATELDAGRYPASFEEILDTLAELFEITGTPAERIPTTDHVRAAAARLLHRGLLFSPELALTAPATDVIELLTTEPATLLGVPPQLPDCFNPGTTHVWRLVDAHRNPQPEADLRRTLEELSPRQQAVLRTLHANGGVGHSAAFAADADPDHPLAKMVSAGVLDLIDDTTARISGRVQQALREAVVSPAGGTWVRPDSPDSPHAPTPADPTEADSSVAEVVQFLTELADILEEVAQAPLAPLAKGGIGVRDVRKLAKQLGRPEDYIVSRLDWLLACGLIALDETTPRYQGSPAHVYAVTERALDVLEADIASQWAELLLGWAGSGYSPWMHHEELRQGHPQLWSAHTARIRRFLPEALLEAGPSRADVWEHVWRLRPYLAWSTPQAHWERLVEDMAQLGLVVLHGDQVAITPALQGFHAALATPEDAPETPREVLTAHLQSLLPAYTDMLIVQGDHTILAPGPLRPEDAHMLSSFATKESSGIATVWRVTPALAQQAIAQGRSAEAILDFLGRMSPARTVDSLPQSLRYLLSDAQRAVSAGRAPQTDAGSFTAYRVPTPVGTVELPPREREELRTIVVPQVVEQVQEYRDATGADGLDGDGAVTATTPAEIKEALRQAESARTPVEVSYADADNQTVTVLCQVVTVSPSRVTVVRISDQDILHLHMHRMIGARMGGFDDDNPA
ncbi:hypothetical protein F7230_09785 [Corynebacterium sp. 320]|uniref:helicase-associated domain-containing protein n=1 Tax=Corynebacterium TaxID=1716 RepID=UPI00125CBC90|nr:MULTISPECIES: helicase-associated domain-containing protein [Corynebacterium]KAB1501342.1 hypothetical protein F7230_09785 [Corynebacterium sp. 320]KAB1551511.1 hypothetical protein F7233_08455 [Corynebacterium sp. 321]KAB3525707.1 hypothetical protein F8354_09785 [Corynebacterium sp. 250]QNP92610.1 helicase-associated domain-containing protein [Corynebacterium zhongnanshanii]